MFLYLVVKRLYLIVVVVVKRLYLITPVLSLLHLGYFIPVIIIYKFGLQLSKYCCVKKYIDVDLIIL